MKALDLELVLVTTDQAADLATVARRVHQYVNYSYPGSWRLTILDHASSDSTWDEAIRVAAKLRNTSARRVPVQRGRKELRAEFASSPATTAAFVTIAVDTDLDDVLAPLLRQAAVVTSSGLSRRQVLTSVGGLGALALLAACSSKTPAASPSESTAAPASSSVASTNASTTTATKTASTTPSAAASPTAPTTTPTTAATANPGEVVLAAEMTEGPYWLDLNMVRTDIRETETGAPLALKLSVLDVASGKPIEGASVDIWQCNAEGIYSGFTAASAASNPGGSQPAGGQAGVGQPAGAPPPGGRGGGAGGAQKTDDTTFLRGIQMTDKSGAATFTTVYPGWYNGRTVHIHVKVNAGGKTIHTGQLFFDDAYTDTVYKDTAPYNARSARKQRNSNDGIFNGGGAGSVLAITKDEKGYTGSMTMGVQTS
jgi:protocatechuate 3,4-dioxygenase beta subunit